MQYKAPTADPAFRRIERDSKGGTCRSFRYELEREYEDVCKLNASLALSLAVPLSLSLSLSLSCYAYMCRSLLEIMSCELHLFFA